MIHVFHNKEINVNPFIASAYRRWSGGELVEEGGGGGRSGVVVLCVCVCGGCVNEWVSYLYFSHRNDVQGFAFCCALLWTTRMHPFHIVNVIGADDLVTQGARTSAAMALTMFTLNIFRSFSAVRQSFFWQYMIHKIAYNLSIVSHNFFF